MHMNTPITRVQNSIQPEQNPTGNWFHPLLPSAQARYLQNSKEGNYALSDPEKKRRESASFEKCTKPVKYDATRVRVRWEVKKGHSRLGDQTKRR